MIFAALKFSVLSLPAIRFGVLLSTFAVLFPLAAFAQSSRQLERDKSPKKLVAENRTALVIGNSTYATSPLANPANDATDMAVALKELDFEVFSGVNQSRAEMIRLVRQFGERLKTRGGVGLFYYAGHGVQVEGRNFLVPTDASIRSENEVELEAMDVSRVLVEMENAGNSLNVVVLDACRNNPFTRSWRSTNDGLAQINAPTGTMIAYSTAPGKVASDGTGRNAPYTAALLKAIKIPDLSLSDVFMQVRADVQRVTKRQQTPWEASSIIGRFYFQKGTGTSSAAAGGMVTSDAQIEQEYWDSVKDSRSAADLHGYLKEYPTGRFATLARLRAGQLGTAITNPVKGNSGGSSSGTIKKNSMGMELVYIQSGEFMMGSESGEADEKPSHRVKISQGFWMGKFEVTQSQYESVIGTNPSNFKGCADCPVEQVSWDDAKEFISQINAKNDGFVYSLPTEAQWEYAARAGTTGMYAGSLNEMGWYDKNSDGKTHPVGQKQPNGFGLYDMHGNVWEWCEDWFGNYSDGAVTDPKGAGDGIYRVLRGGSWYGSANDSRSAFRFRFITPSYRFENFGFRVSARSK